AIVFARLSFSKMSNYPGCQHQSFCLYRRAVVHSDACHSNHTFVILLNSQIYRDLGDHFVKRISPCKD
ncbi:hypothetical protein SK128_004960, partial [Halocaridina rubra]